LDPQICGRVQAPFAAGFSGKRASNPATFLTMQNFPYFCFENLCLVKNDMSFVSATWFLNFFPVNVRLKFDAFLPQEKRDFMRQSPQ